MPIGALDVATLRAVAPWKLASGIVLRWMVGAPLVGGALGLALGFILAGVAIGRSRAGGAEFDSMRADIEARFADAPPSVRHYVRWKLRLDPIYAALPAMASGREMVLDLGCGLGLAALTISMANGVATVIGIDHDATKIQAGRAAAAALPIELAIGNLIEQPLPAADLVLLLDVLHYFDAAARRRLLERVAGSLRPGGLVVVRETDPEAHRAWLTRAIERAAIALGWNRGQRVDYASLDALLSPLAECGFRIERRPLAGPLHPGNVLLIAQRSC
jgi:SAM-dependent methyltransferase